MRFSANDPEGLDKTFKEGGGGLKAVFISKINPPTTSKVELHPLILVKDDISDSCQNWWMFGGM